MVRYVINGIERQYRLPKPYRSTGGDGFYSLADAREDSSKIWALARQGIDYQIKLEQKLRAEYAIKQLDERRLSDQAELDIIENLTVENLFDAWLADGVRRRSTNRANPEAVS